MYICIYTQGPEWLVVSGSPYCDGIFHRLPDKANGFNSAQFGYATRGPRPH